MPQLSHNNPIRSVIKSMVTIVSDSLDNNATLIDGNAGKLLFLLEAHNSLLEKATEDALKKGFKNTLRNLTQNHNLSYSYGLVGIGTVFHCCKTFPFEVNFEPFYNELDDLAEREVRAQWSSGELDFLHGITGIGLYAIARNNEHLMNLVIQAMYDLAVKDNEGYRWYSKYEIEVGKEIDVVQISISHGTASVINVLSQCIVNGLGNIELARDILNNSLSFLKKQKLNNSASIFPEVVGTNDNNSSRLAWCNGDLGIGISMLITAVNLNNSDLFNEATDILIETTKRRTREETRVIDYGLCHGTAGICVIYKVAFEITKNKKFNEAYKYWFSSLLEEGERIARSGEYKSFGGLNEGWIPDIGYINGLAGIGLVLNDYITVENTNWKSTLLLSNIR